VSRDPGMIKASSTQAVGGTCVECTAAPSSRSAAPGGVPTDVGRHGDEAEARREGIGVKNREDYDENLRALRRLIAYIRDEAARLRLVDVALLLERAEDAVSSLIPGTIELDALQAQACSASIIEH